MKLEDLVSNVTLIEIEQFRRGPARRFFQNSPLKPPPRLIDRLLDGADAIDAPGLFRPVVLNILGLALHEFDQAVTRRPERLVQTYFERAVTQPSIRDIAPKIIGKMISNKGTKLPRTIDELKQETGLNDTDITFCLIRMEARQLARRIDVNPALWEISHDFVARQLGLLLGRLRPNPWPAVATWAAPIFLALMLVGIVAGVPLYLRQQASDEMRRAGFLIAGSKQLEVTVPTSASDAELKRIIPQEVALLGPVQTLNLSFSQVTDISPLKGLLALRTLNLHFSRVTDISPLKGLPALQTLDFSFSRVTDISPLKGLPALQTLNLGFSPVTDISPLKGLPHLQTLDLHNMRVTDISPLKGLPALQTLNLSFSPVTDITSLKGLPHLQALNLSGSQVTDISPLKELPALQTLWLSVSRITDITPLKGLPHLQTLNLSGSQVTDITPLKGLSALQTLYLSGSQITDITPLEELPHLQTLYRRSPTTKRGTFARTA
jgi:hypothetical protein